MPLTCLQKVTGSLALSHTLFTVTINEYLLHQNTPHWSKQDELNKGAAGKQCLMFEPLQSCVHAFIQVPKYPLPHVQTQCSQGQLLHTHTHSGTQHMHMFRQSEASLVQKKHQNTHILCHRHPHSCSECGTSLLSGSQHPFGSHGNQLHGDRQCSQVGQSL